MAHLAEADKYKGNYGNALVIDANGIRAAATEYRVMPEFRVAQASDPVGPNILKLVANGAPPLARVVDLQDKIIRGGLPSPVIKDVTPSVSAEHIIGPVVDEIERAAHSWRLPQEQAKKGDWLNMAGGARLDHLFYPKITIDPARSVSVNGMPMMPVIAQTPSEVAARIRHVLQEVTRQGRITINQTATVGRLNFTEVYPAKRVDPLFIWDEEATDGNLQTANDLFVQQEKYACMGLLQREPHLQPFFPNSGTLFDKARGYAVAAGTYYLNTAVVQRNRTYGEILWLAQVLHGGDGNNIFRGVEIFFDPDSRTEWLGRNDPETNNFSLAGALW